MTGCVNGIWKSRRVGGVGIDRSQDSVEFVWSILEKGRRRKQVDLFNIYRIDSFRHHRLHLSTYILAARLQLQLHFATRSILFWSWGCLK